MANTNASHLVPQSELSKASVTHCFASVLRGPEKRQSDSEWDSVLSEVSQKLRVELDQGLTSHGPKTKITSFY